MGLDTGVVLQQGEQGKRHFDKATQRSAGLAAHHIRNHFLFPSAGALSSTMPVRAGNKESVKRQQRVGMICLCVRR
jgi:hypothetical protein